MTYRLAQNTDTAQQLPISPAGAVIHTHRPPPTQRAEKEEVEDDEEEECGTTHILRFSQVCDVACESHV